MKNFKRMLKIPFLNWIIAFLIYVKIASVLSVRYQPSWPSLDSRPLPEWYDNAKIGVFLHFGVYSVPALCTEWFWMAWKQGNPEIKQYMKRNYPINFTYQDFAPEFRLEFFNASEWAVLFKQAGIKYVVLTSKHHEGYTMWPSKYSFSWNSMDIGPKRDIIGEVSKAVREANLHFGLYHSLFEWFHPLYNEDKSNNFSTQYFVKTKTMPELYELVNNYQPEVLWSDGDWEASPEYWDSLNFLAWLYNDSPVKDSIAVNDRWGIGAPCKHGGFWNCKDHFVPKNAPVHKWENAFTVDKKSWGFRRNMKIEDIRTIRELILELLYTVSKGGNVLINVGPTKEGVIAPIFQERLLSLGKWLSICGEGIYLSKPWIYPNDNENGTVFYTSTKNERKSIIYAFFTSWPLNNILELAKPKATTHTSVSLLGWGKVPHSTVKGGGGITVKLPMMSSVKTNEANVWGLKLENVRPNLKASASLITV